MINPNMYTQILNQLYEYSNNCINVREDINLQIPAFSTIEKDIYGKYTPIILVNTKLIPNNINIIAHILSHEWGHHVLRHMTIEPPNFNTEEFDAIQEKENEADLYAANFIKEYSYDVDNIKEFMKEHPGDLENRLNILQSVY
jgi:Zn-dependent peptidase ImmA (M78 family)